MDDPAPPTDVVRFYLDPANPGYLADPWRVAGLEVWLRNPQISTRSKDPKQTFYGLEPGWVVNLRDKSIYKPLEKELQDYYKS